MQDYLGRQVAELRRHARGVPAGQAEEIHQMRVAARRLRSLLASGRSLFEDGAVEPVREELRWLSAVLGAARDPAVVQERLRALLAREPESLRWSLETAAQRIDEDLNAAASAGRAAAAEALAGTRYARLLAALDALVTAPPLAPKAGGRPGRLLNQLVVRDERRLAKAVAALDSATGAGPGNAGPGSADRDAALHTVRKAAKRLRYSAELAADPAAAALTVGNRPTGKTISGKLADNGKPGKRRRHAKRAAKSARKIQQLLGQHQDSVVARARLADLAVQAAGRGENSFAYGRLHAREESQAAAAERAFRKLWRKVRPPKATA